ncbi:Thionin-like protein [Melia azedarach]|uniref:Thionin-like protein n=1 Tax=Melia azedarach TaxID=155640 RepID=A0ACC1Y3U2_MELAZ|nr:Thionin-like protein [Melia azedarach]
MEKVNAVVQFLLMASLVLGLLVGQSIASCHSDCSAKCSSHPSENFKKCVDDCLKTCNPGNDAQYFCKLGCASSLCAKLSTKENHPAAEEELSAESLANGCTTALPDANKKKMKQQKNQVDATKKQQTKPDAAKMKAKPIVGNNGVTIREKETRKPKQNLNSRVPKNQDAVVEKETLSLKDYEKELSEKKKALNSKIKKPADHEEEKFTLDDEVFEWMKAVGEKKKNDDPVHFTKPKSSKEKAGEAKAHKLVDVSGFLKPLRSERSSAAANGGSKFTGRFSGKESAAAAEHGGRSNGDPTLNIEDHIQFPALK